MNKPENKGNESAGNPACPLLFLDEGELAEIVEFTKPVNINHPSHSELYFRLDEMGLRAGRKVQMLNNSHANSILVKIENSRLALPKKIAMKIYVRRSE